MSSISLKGSLYQTSCALLVCVGSILSLNAAPPSSPTSTPPHNTKEQPLLKDIWEAVYLDGHHVGHQHRTFREIKINNQVLVESTIELDMSFQRNRQPVRLHTIHATHESPSGKLRSFILQEGVGSSQRLYRKGRVDGQHLIWTTQMGSRAPSEKKLPWKEQALGLYAQEAVLSQRKQNDKQFLIHRFEPVFDTILPVKITILQPEETQLLQSEKKKLVKTEWQLEGVTEQDAPPEWVWINEQGECLKRQIRLSLLGEMICYRTTEPIAKRSTGLAQLDIGRNTSFPLERALPQPQRLTTATYRATLIGFDDISKAFPSDSFQTVRSIGEQQVEIRVMGWQRPMAKTVFGSTEPLAPPREYLTSNDWLTADHALVKQLTQQAVGLERDAWQKALRIERWVQRNMQGFQTTEGFATAAEVAQKLSGDCKGHAVLAAAMCRAAGVPSRIAIGLVYVPREKAMGFHMWLEVWIEGQWIGLDPTQGLGGVGADHIKITDHHLNDQSSFAPMMSVARLVGKMQLEVISVGQEGR